MVSAMRRAVLPLIAAAIALAGCGSDASEPAERPVTLVLDFAPNGAHAGIYEALEQDSDGDHDVRLRVRQPTSSSDSLKLLAVGRADLAVADIHDLGLARERGEDLVGVGALVQRPLASVIAAREVSRPRDLEGERVGVTGVPSDEAVLRSVVSGDGGDPRKVRRITIGFTAVPSLLAGKVAGATAFWNAEGVTLKRRGFKSREFRVDDYGAPPYPELVLVARRETVDDDPELIRDTLAALADGTDAALEDRAGAARLVADAAQAREALIRAQVDAIAPALEPPMRLDEEALDGWARFDDRFGILKEPPDLERAFDTSLAP